jgi:ADP-ribose pyrophosphatase YjhB (NUDIX family)
MIRTLAVAVPVRDGRALVEHGGDPTTGARFYRAIGGGVEPGERAIDAVVREWHEELGVTLRPGRLLGVLENIFTYRGAPGHEVVFVYEGAVDAEGTSAPDRFEVVEANGLVHDAEWVSLERLRSEGVPLYPTGLLQLLTPG